MRVFWLAPVHYASAEDVHPAPWISTLAKALVENYGVELTIVNYQPRLERMELSFEKDGIRYVFLKTPSPKWDHLGNFKRRIEIVREYLVEHRASYDIIHVHGSEHQYEASVLDTDIAFVLSMQGVMGACLAQLKERWTYRHLSWWMSSRHEKKGLAHVPEFICRTHFDTGIVRDANPNARIHENWEMIRPEFFEDLGSTEVKTLLYMGGDHPIKGLDLALQAMDQIRAQVEVKLCIVGKAEANKVAQLIEALGLTHLSMDDIDLRGFQDVDGVVQAMDESYLMLHTSLIDNSPNSVCEAQVAGLPVVCTDVGGVSSLIKHGHTGMLASLNPSDIAAKALKLIRNPELHSALKQKSRSMARERHAPETITDRTIKIYRKVLSAHAGNTNHIQEPA